VGVRDELEPVLARLIDQRPNPLTMWPQLDSDEGRQQPPIAIDLAAWAASTAEDLHRQFGDDVELTVGALRYPSGRPGRYLGGPVPPADLLDPLQIEVELDGPAVVSSGYTLWHCLLLRNLTGREIQIATNRQVTAKVVDPETGDVVGGFAGLQQRPLKVFRVTPGETERIPLVVGTASFVSRLGYAVPAGEWGLQVTLTLGPHPRDSPRGRTPVLPLTVTA
jgi:hypothetical protein